MSLPDLLFGRLRLLISFEVSSLRTCLERLASEDYPSDVVPGFIAELLKELEDHKGTVSRISRLFLKNPEGAVKLLRSERRKLVKKAELITVIENARTRNVPWSLVPTLEEIAAKLNPTDKLLVSCPYCHSYAILLRKIAGCRILLIPATHRLDPFLHVLIGHELFHPILDDYVSKEQAIALNGIRSAFDNQFSLLKIDKTRKDKIIERLRGAWEFAIREIMCDMGCAALFGPAALLAMSSWATTVDLNALPDLYKNNLYPPFRYRLRSVMTYALKNDSQSSIASLIELLEKETDLRGFSETLRTYVNTIEKETLDTTDQQAIDKDPLLKIIYVQVWNSLPKAWQYVQEMATRFERAWPSVVHEVPLLLRSMLQFVPPGELRTAERKIFAPASLAAIMVATWLYDLSRSTEHLDELKDYHRSCRLMFKAVEDAHLKGYFLSRQEKLDGGIN